MAHLRGMTEIVNYTRRSESTIIGLIHNSNFPAKKISSRIWESDTDLIDAWRKNQIEVSEKDPMEEPKKGKRPMKGGTKYIKKTGKK